VANKSIQKTVYEAFVIPSITSVERQMTLIQMSEKQWSEPEKWVWQEICSGRTADFNARGGRQDTPLEPTTSQDWGDDRKLSSNFLKQILLRQPCSAEIPVEGARIVGAWFFEGIDLGHGRLARQLWLEHCRFEGTANLDGLQIDGWFSLEGSTFIQQGADTKSLQINGATINGHVSFSLTKFKDMDLTGTKVGGQLSLDGATFDGKLEMNGLEVGRHLFMGKGAKFKEVDLANAKVGGQLNLDGATFDGKLNMNGLEVGSHLFMGKGAKFKEVDLANAKVGGQLNLDGATFDGKLNMYGLVVKEQAFMGGSTFSKQVSLLFARFERNVYLSDSEFTGLDLSGTWIEGELELGSDRESMTRWRNGAAITLRNVHAGTLQDRRERVVDIQEKRLWWQLFRERERWKDAWPAELHLDGFTYDRLGGFGGETARSRDLPIDYDVDMQVRDIRWYINWLARDPSYNPQHYEQLAGVFRAAGDPAKANRILYESHLRARTDVWRQHQYFRWLGSSLLNWTIGYGLGGQYFRALGWVIMFTTIGAGVLYFSGQPIEGLASGLSARVIYSLDQLLPIVEFEKYDKVVLTGIVAYYFYFERLVGWVLGSFLVAGLAGLTQKQ
jgi:hypothetical protein